MKTISAFLLLFIVSFNYAQTTVVNINAVCVAYNGLYNKAFVIVDEHDPNYPSSLLQLEPLTGSVEKSLPLSGSPRSILLTPDKTHLYVSYQELSKIDKIDLENFQVSGTVYTGIYQVLDFAILPQDENVIFVILGEDESPDNVAMYKNGIIQPKQVICNMLTADYASELCVKNDGSRLYVHNSISDGHECYLMDVAEDGIEYDGIEWKQMIRSFSDIKNHNDLIYGGCGDIIDAFSDSIPITRASLPLYLIIGDYPWRAGFDYSEVHGSYVYGHFYDYKACISFFDGQYYNYLGSIETGVDVDNVSDIDIVDEKHFILVAYDSYQGSNLLIFQDLTQDQVSLKAKDDNSDPAAKKWYENYNLKRLEVKNDNFCNPAGDHY
jgi:DNA-binding beta-propeller fold protein YncE